MSEQYTLKVEFINPTNIESEVPGQQKIREPNFSKNGGNVAKNGENVANNGENGAENEDDDANYVPVMTVTKEEAAFTKSSSDLKLQKVSVTENISENEKKPRSRIPKMRFRQAAEKVKNERRRSRDENEPTSPAALLRRSSIPRLKKRTVSTTETNNNEETKATSNNNKPNEPLEDEFDKIYDEIIHTANTTPIVDTTTLDKVKIEDEDELEHSFEEIIHDYEENKVQPIDVKQVRSRIPLIKQKSLPEEKFAKKLDRRSSLKNITIDDGNTVQNNVVKGDRNDNNSDYIDNNAKGDFEDTKKADVKDIGNDKRETVKVVTPILSKTEKQDATAEGNAVLTNRNEELETVSDSQMPDSSKLVQQISIVQNKNSDDSNKPIVANGSIKNEKKKLEKAEEKEIDKKIPVLKGKVSQLVNKIASNDQDAMTVPKKEFTSEAPKKTFIMSKIAVFNKDKADNTDRPNDFRKIKTFSNLNHLKKLDDAFDKTKVPEKLHEEAFEKLNFEKTDNKDTLNINHTSANNITPPNTPMHYIMEPVKDDTINEYVIKSSKFQQDTNIPKEDSTVGQENENLSNKTNKVENFDPSIDLLKSKHRIEVESIELQTPEVIYPDEEPLEAYNNDLNVEEVNEEVDEEIIIPKGKVSRIINRIVSQDDSLGTKKEPVIDVPIKRSVSSKIALFERQITVDNSAHKPRIIDEVLKAQPPRKPEPYDHHDTDYVVNNENVSPKMNDHLEGLLKDSFNDDSQTVLIDDSLEIRKQASIIVEETIQHVSTIIDVQHDEQSDYNEFSDQKEEFNSEIDNFGKPKEDTKEIVTEKDLKTKHSYEEKEFKPKMNEYLRVEDRLRRMQYRNEDNNIKKTKSTADLHIEEAVKGKVHQMIVRMNSVEKLEVEKKSPISVKEQPRKRSVLEKIALFEQKLISADSVNSTSTLRPVANQTMAPVAPAVAPAVAPDTPSPTDNSTELSTTNTIMLSTNTTLPPFPEQYRAKIEGLLSAKATYGVMQEMKYITFANGEKMPVLALGTALMDPVLLPYIIGAAIDLGFRAIDTAYIYGNEEAIGDAIQAKIKDGTVKREDLFIIGKLWSTYHRRDLVPGACAASLRNLRLEYFDLYLVHNPMSFKEGGDPIPKIANVIQYSDIDYLDAWYGMEDLVAKGLAKSIGVSNFNSQQVGRLVEKGKIKPVVDQVECHPYLNQQRLHDFCAERGVKLMCFGALGSKGTPQEYKATSAAVIDDPLIKVMAAGMGGTPAQLLIKYQLLRGHAVVVKSSSALHLWDNLQAIKLKMKDQELDAVNALNTNKRAYFFTGMGDTHKNYPFKIPF